jgi:RNA polymerase sigma-70 factor (ECF subfamily)
VLAAGVAHAFDQHRPFLWGLCYRLTGSAADADDLVQETFVRALERPPERIDVPWRPWLVRVALNLGRDLLRRRRRRRYVGPWLPSPVETGSDESPPSFEAALGEGRTTEGRYDLLESVSYAFLLALEALTPQQRAVLLLRDVFDYTVQEAADALALSVPNVKTTHHRARRAMAKYDGGRQIPTRSLQAETRAALERFLGALGSGDVRRVEALLAESVVALSDGGGEFFAARVPLRGPERVTRFFSTVTRKRAFEARSEFRMVNGVPALVSDFLDDPRGAPPRMVLVPQIDAAGRLVALYAIVASRKLTAIPPVAG